MFHLDCYAGSLNPICVRCRGQGHQGTKGSQHSECTFQGDMCILSSRRAVANVHAAFTVVAVKVVVVNCPVLFCLSTVMRAHICNCL